MAAFVSTLDHLRDMPAEDGILSLVEKLTREGLIGMNAAARLYGSCRGRRPTHSSTPTRHAMKGVLLPNGRVVKLEAIRICDRLMTSEAAVMRFFAAQQMTPPTAPPASPPRSPAARTRSAAAAALSSTGS